MNQTRVIITPFTCVCVRTDTWSQQAAHRNRFKGQKTGARDWPCVMTGHYTHHRSSYILTRVARCSHLKILLICICRLCERIICIRGMRHSNARWAFKDSTRCCCWRQYVSAVLHKPSTHAPYRLSHGKRINAAQTRPCCRRRAAIYDRRRLPSSKHRDYVNYIYGIGRPTQLCQLG